MSAPAPSRLDANQCIQGSFDEAQGLLRTSATLAFSGDLVCDIDAATGDNIALASADGTKKVDVETVGGKNALDVKVLNQIEVNPSGLKTSLLPTRIVVTDTATALPATPLANRNGLSVRNLGPSTIYIGNSSVTALNGYPKFSNEEIILDITNDVVVYAICATGETCNVAILEIA